MNTTTLSTGATLVKSVTHSYVIGERTNGKYYVLFRDLYSGREGMQDFAEYDKALQFARENARLDNQHNN